MRVAGVWLVGLIWCPLGHSEVDSQRAPGMASGAEVQARPHITLVMLQEMLAQPVVRSKPRYRLAVPAWLWVQFQKKTLVADERERPDVKRCRDRWQQHQERFDPTRLVFIDETWMKTNMVPLRGQAPKGERLPGEHFYLHCRVAP